MCSETFTAPGPSDRLSASYCHNQSGNRQKRLQVGLATPHQRPSRGSIGCVVSLVHSAPAFDLTHPPASLDEALYPYAGPCAFCGRPDKRHRMFDAIREAHRAGDSVGLLADGYLLTPAQVEWIIGQPRFPHVREARALSRERSLTATIGG